MSFVYFSQFYFSTSWSRSRLFSFCRKKLGLSGLPEGKTPAVTVSHGSTRNQSVPGYSGINL